MTSFKISEIDGVMVEKKEQIFALSPEINFAFRNIYRAGIDAQCSVRVRFNREKVAKILYWRMTARDQHGAWDDAGRERDWKGLDEKGKYYHIADAIISAGAGLLEVEK